jgi:type I restriction enzyme S subunit
MEKEKIINWEECKLDDICVRIVDGSHNPPKSQGSGYSMLSAKDVFDNKIDFSSPRFLDEASFIEENKRTDIKPGDVLLTIVATIGRTAVVPKNAPKFTLQRSVAVIKSLINSHYLCYYFQSQFFQNQLREHAKGTAQKGVYLTTLSNLTIRIAPPNEQNRIVLKLDELLSELEKGKEQLRTSLEQLKVYRQSILKYAFEGKLSEEWRNKQKKLKTPDELVVEIKEYRKLQYEKQLIEYKAGKTKVKPREPKEIIQVSSSELKSLSLMPNGWTWVKVSSLGEIETGTTPSKAKPEYFGGKYPFYKPTELDAGFNVKEAKEYLSESGIKQARFLPINSILVTSIGATIGKTGIIRVEGASNQQINAIVPHEIFNPNFLYFQAVGQQFQDQIQLNAVATTLPIINKSKFERLVFAICSFEEQNFIVDDIETKFSIIDKLEESIIQNLKFSDTLRQSLLQKAFIGKLVEQDPHDEPASMLLERIKKEREEYLIAETGRKKIERSLYIKPRKMAEELKQIIEILRESDGQVTAKNLWQASKHMNDIDEFYAALKKHIEAGEIIELPRNGKESYLKLARAK